MHKHTFVRERSLTARGCKYKEIDWFEYSEEEQDAVRRKRRTRSRASPPKIKRLNDERSRKMFRWVLFNNFEQGDLHVTLTFAELPATDADAKRAFDNFVKSLRRLYGKHQAELKYMYVKEDIRSGVRMHWHVVMNNCGISRDEIEALWKHGWANADRLRPDAKDGLYGLAKYLTKSMKNAEKFKRSWNCSTNLLRPEKSPEIVTDDNKISKRRMKRLIEAVRNDEVKPMIESYYKGFELIHSTIGHNEVTGRPFARLCLMRKKE